MLRTFAFALAALLLAAPASAATQSTAALKAALARDVNGYLATRSKIEHLSAISLSVSLKGRAEHQRRRRAHPVRRRHARNDREHLANRQQYKGVYRGDDSAARGGRKADDRSDRRAWLPQYPAWKNVTIRRLLSMTSGIPTYDDTDQMLADYAKTPKHNFTIPELIAYVYPTNPHAPKPTTGYSYSNTNYLLAELIIERASDNVYKDQLDRRFLRSGPHLSDTYYAPTQYPPDVLARIPAAYFVNNDPDNAALSPLLGPTFASTAFHGCKVPAALPRPQDLARWARALYTGPMLAPKQRAELLSLVSTKTGKPIARRAPQIPAVSVWASHR